MEGGLFGQNCEEVSDEVSKGRAARHTRVERLWGERGGYTLGLDRQGMDRSLSSSHAHIAYVAPFCKLGMRTSKSITLLPASAARQVSTHRVRRQYVHQ